MSIKRDNKCKEQFDRQSTFPPNRIAFCKTASWGDMYSMIRYADGMLTLDRLCEIVCENNFLETYFKDKRIPADMMLNELRICGYECREGNQR